MNQQVNFRISAYQTGDRSNPRYVWGVGIPIDLMDQLPESNHRVQLEADDNKLYVKFNGEGISLKKPNPTSTMLWSSHIGLHHVKGLTMPDEVVRARGVNGSWDEANKRIVVDDVPDFVKTAMNRSLHHVPDPDDQFPATHFSEDVAEASGESAKPEYLTRDSTTDEIVDEAQVESSPNSATYQWFLAQVKKGQEGPFSELVDLTPELADILLRRNVGNRTIRAAKLNQYISDITNDRWQVNGESLMISVEGDLNNGQHRCSAVIAANTPIRTFMTFGVSRESRTTVDVGANRRPGDHLAVMGYKNSTVLAGVTRFVLAYEAEDRTGLTYVNRITAAAINERVQEDELLQEASSFTVSNSKVRRLAPPSVAGFVYYEFSKVDAEAAKTFMEQVINGEGLEAGDPAYTVRETLISRPGLSRECKTEVFFRGWNAYRQNKKLRAMRIMYDLPKLV